MDRNQLGQVQILATCESSTEEEKVESAVQKRLVVGVGVGVVVGKPLKAFEDWHH